MSTLAELITATDQAWTTAVARPPSGNLRDKLTGDTHDWHRIRPRIPAAHALAQTTDTPGARATPTDSDRGGKGGHGDPTARDALAGVNDHQAAHRIVSALQRITTACHLATATHNPAALWAAHDAMQTLVTLVDRNDPDRRVEDICPNPTCGQAIPIGATKCLKCLPTPEPKARTCANCGKEMRQGQHLRDGECMTCYQYRRRNGTDRVADLSASGLVADGEKMG